MISRLRGLVWESKPLHLVIDVGGVGYAVEIPKTDNLPRVGDKIELLTVAVYREDSATLYGFRTEDERNFFKILVEKVSGIGPKTALSILTNLPIERLLAAVESGDLATLKATPGIGKKTAERLLLELKGISFAPGSAALVAGSPVGDAMAALVSLGYSQADALKAVNQAAQTLPDSSANELIRLCLKKD